MDSRLIASLAITAVLIGWIFWSISSKPETGTGVGTSSVVSIIDGNQFIDITAKGGYFPRVVIAKADMPTVLHVNTRGTFDCSASLIIPKLSYQKFLQPSGTENIAINADQAQGTLQGLCAMGMYNFQVIFQ